MKRFTVLIIESDSQVSGSLADFLDSSSYEVMTAADAQPALECVRRNGLPNIALIASQLPGMSGFALASDLKAKADLPVIFLLAGDDVDGASEELKKYADDFLVKPLDLRELQLRLQLVLSRVPVIDYDGEPVIVDNNLSIDFAHNRIEVAGKVLGLTPTESILLHVLLRHAPRVVNNRTLLSRVWSADYVNEDTLRVHMHRLRRKLEVDSHHPHYIRTERGVGYRFTQRPPRDRADSN